MLSNARGLWVLFGHQRARVDALQWEQHDRERYGRDRHDRERSGATNGNSMIASATAVTDQLPKA